MNHIKKDILFSLVEGSLTEDLHKKAEEHLAMCDRCFTLYASLKSSNMEIENADMEETPHDLYIKAESEMGNIQVPPEEEIHIPKEKYQHIKADALYEKVSMLQQISKYSSKIIPLAFVAVIAVLVVYKDQQLISPDAVPIAEGLQNEKEMESETSPNSLNNFITPSMKTSLNNLSLNNRISPQEGDSAEKTILAKNLKDQSIVLAYYEPSENTMVTRTIPSPRKVPDLIGKNLEEIAVLLKSEGIRYIVYKSTGFKQFPESGKYLMSNDTLKIYYKD